MSHLALIASQSRKKSLWTPKKWEKRMIWSLRFGMSSAKWPKSRRCRLPLRISSLMDSASGLKTTRPSSQDRQISILTSPASPKSMISPCSSPLPLPPLASPSSLCSSARRLAPSWLRKWRKSNFWSVRTIHSRNSWPTSAGKMEPSSGRWRNIKVPLSLSRANSGPQRKKRFFNISKWRQY